MTETEDMMEMLRREFLDEAWHLLNDCEEVFLRLADPTTRTEDLAHIFRAFHSVKGSGGVVGLTDIVAFAHVVEECLSALRQTPEKLSDSISSVLLRCCDSLRDQIQRLKQEASPAWDKGALETEIHQLLAELRGEQPGVAPPAESAVHNVTKSAQSAPKGHVASAGGSVKVDARRVESVLDLVGELVVIKSQLSTSAAQRGDDLPLQSLVSLLDKTVRELQDRALSMRMTPLKPVFVKLERLVRDLGPKLGKQVDLTIEGEDTEIDRNMVEVIADPLMHMVRNAIDHGLEATVDRGPAGKPDLGQLSLSARQRGGRIEIRISDDGRGINREKVYAKALGQGLIDGSRPLTDMSAAEVYDLLLAPGFSTADQVSDVSGRGVGLDVVKTHVQKIKGSIAIDSQLGKGTTFILSIPLTASITDGMIVLVSGQSYVIPMERIRELVKIAPDSTAALNQQESIIIVRDRTLPWFDINAFVGNAHRAQPRPATASGSGLFVIVEHDDHLVGLKVDSIIGQSQVVLKPFDEELHDVPGIAGATILGDGCVALIIDTESLIRQASGPAAEAARIAA